MGINFTFDSPCWVLHVFSSKNERDNYVKKHEYSENGNRVFVAVTAKEAASIVKSEALKELRENKSHDKIMEEYSRIFIH